MDEESIFAAALEQAPGAARAAFLEGACRGDAQLMSRVAALLASHEQAGTFLNEPAAPMVTIDRPITEKPGTQIGPYKLLQQLGEGGMGVVYLAEQKEPVKRRVALKIIKPGMDTRQVIARFEAERQALAMMDHPNIAKVLDAGATDSGRPYFVMELVNGLPVTKYCDDQHLTPKERLELFLPICQAVQHAHQKGIIHRDLKPSNILVALYDGRPVPKIIDFGVAKATSQTLTEKTMFTQLGQVVGTLEYMSPEQAQRNQLDIDTRSDIYSLGVVLYELLTGETPFDRERLRSIAFEEMLRIIREEEPPRPSIRLSGSHTLPSVAASRNVEPARLSSLVRGELDWIVMKALEKDRGRRYETAVAFANDVRHYLNDEPVAACPPSMAYRFRKFARRNRARLVGLVVFAPVLLVAVSGIGWAVRDRIAQQAQVAQEKSERQARVREQLELILRDVDQLMPEFQWDEALAVAKRAEAVLAGGEATSDVKARVERAVADLEMVQRLEKIRLFRSESENAGETCNRDYEAAFQEYGINLNVLPADLAANSFRRHKRVLPALIAALDDWAACRRELKDEAGARDLSELAQTVDNNPWSRRVREAVAANDTPMLEELARNETVMYQAPSAVVLLAKALDRDKPQLAAKVLDGALRAHPDDFWLQYSAGTVSQFTTGAHYEFPSYSVSHNLVLWRDANESIRHLTAALAIRPENVAAWNKLGDALAMQGRPDEAVACYRRAVELDPSSDESLHNFSDALLELGKYEEAFAFYRNAIKGDPRRPLYHYKLGDLFYKQGKQEEAIACYRKAVELDPNDGDSRHRLGLALEKQGKLDEAMACYRDAVEAPEVKPKDLACQRLALLLKRHGKPEEAIACYRKLAAAATPNRPMAQGYLGDELKSQGKLDEAISCYRKAIEIDSQYPPAYSGLAHALRLQGNPDEAIDCYRKLVDLDAHDRASWNQLGVVLEQVGRGDEALLCYQKVVDLRPHDGVSRWQLGQALERQNKLDEAMACYRDAVEAPEVEPKSQAWHRLAQLLKRHGKPEEVIECYREIAKATPNEPGPQCDLARELKAQGQLDDALYHYRRAAEIDPEWAPAYIGLSAVSQQMGNSRAAVDAYRKAVELSDDGGGPHINLGLALQRIGEHENAIAEFQKGVEYFSKAHDREPENQLYTTNLRIALMDLGVALRGQGRYAEALTPFTEIVSLGTPNPQVWGEIAGCQSALGNSEGFDEAYDSLMAQFPKPAARKVAHWGILGQALYRAGRYEDAREALEKTIGLRGESTPSLKQGPRWWYYAMTLYRVGEKEQARAYYDRLAKELIENPPPNKASDEHLRDEAAELLGIGEGATKQLMDSP